MFDRPIEYVIAAGFAIVGIVIGVVASKPVRSLLVSTRDKLADAADRIKPEPAK